MDIFETSLLAQSPDVNPVNADFQDEPPYTGPDGVGPDSSWLSSTDYFAGTWVDFFGQDARYDSDLNGDGILLNSIGEFTVVYDAQTDTAITYAAKAPTFDEPGVITGTTGGTLGIVVGLSHGTNGHTYISGGFGSPGIGYYSMATNDINGLSTGWSGNYQVGTYHGAFTLGGDWATGGGSYGTPSGSHMASI